MTFTILDAVLLAGLVIAVVRLVRQLKYDVNVTLYTSFIAKVFAEGDFDKAEKVNRAIPHASYARMIAAAAAASGDDASAMVVRDAMRTAFERTRSEELERIGRGVWLDALAFAMVLGALVYALLAGVSLSWMHGLASAAAMLLLGSNARARARVRRADAMQAAPVFDAILEGRGRARSPELPPYRAPGRTTDGLEPVLAPVPKDQHVMVIALRHGETVAEAPLPPNGVLRIGRIPKGLTLDDPEVSRMHAVIERSDDTISLIDLGSESGTRYRGSKINKQALQLGDEFGIGPFVLRLDRAESPVGPIAPPTTVKQCGTCRSTDIEPALPPAPLSSGDLRAEVCAGCGQVYLFVHRRS